jgi:hypothetical protein
MPYNLVKLTDISEIHMASIFRKKSEDGDCLACQNI